jgi:pSer/pThr/pTyr-binding forkhead associated (FHA) protein
MPRLIVKGSSGSKVVDLGDEAVTFGRTSDNTIPVDDVGASRKHAQVLFIGRGYEIVDLGSRNGTKVNGTKISRQVLKSGDVISIGAFDITFDDGTGAVADDGGSDGIEIEELDLGGGTPPPPSPRGGGASSSSSAAPGVCVLRILAGERQGLEVPLQGTRTTFGRRASNTVSFQDAAVSGVHCEITREAGGFVLRDLGSTNGTLVDGEPVVETVLHHNARIRVGGQRIVFVDTSVADIESSLSVDDDAGEWGLMRGELDPAAAGRRRGRSGLLAASAVVLVAGGAAAYLVVNQKAAMPVVESVKENRIEDFSFEEGVVRYFAADDEGGPTAAIEGSVEHPEGRSGVQCLGVSPGSGEGPARVVLAGEPFPVAPDTAYEISVAVGSGRGALLVTWLSSSRAGLVRESVSSPVDGDGSWPVSRAVVTAPAHASAARVELVAFGGAPATFDDVVFRRGEGAAPVVTGAGGLSVRVHDGGRIEVVRDGEILIMDGGLASSVDALPEELLGAALDAPPSSSGGGLTATGRLGGEGAATFSTQVNVTESGARIVSVAKSGAGFFTFTVPAATARGGVTVVLERTATVLGEQERMEQEGVRKIILGGGTGVAKPFLLSADPATAGWKLTMARVARGLRISLAPAAGAAPESAAVMVEVDLAREGDAARALLAKADQNRVRNELGLALASYDRVALEWHYLADLRDRGARARDEIQTSLDSRFKEIRRIARSARQFGSAAGLRDVIHRCGVLAREFEGHPRAEEAKALAAEATTDLGALAGDRDETAIQALYERAIDYRDTEEYALGVALLREMLRIAPEDSEFQESGRKELKSLEEKMTTAARSRYEGR